MYHQTKIGQVACQDGSYSTQNFDICATSKSNFEKLAGNPRLQCQFAMDEDQFLFFEKQAVMFGVPKRSEMMSKSAYMKNTYPMIDFSYHDMHIRQGTLPLQVINTATWYSLGMM